jgi:hypothetical protein
MKNDLVVMEVKRGPGGKLHLMTGSYRRTACGFNVFDTMIRTTAAFPWLGPDKCKTCLRALEAGSLGSAVQSRHVQPAELDWLLIDAWPALDEEINQSTEL